MGRHARPVQVSLQHLILGAATVLAAAGMGVAMPDAELPEGLELPIAVTPGEVVARGGYPAPRPTEAPDDPEPARQSSPTPTRSPRVVDPMGRTATPTTTRAAESEFVPPSDGPRDGGTVTPSGSLVPPPVGPPPPLPAITPAVPTVEPVPDGDSASPTSTAPLESPEPTAGTSVPPESPSSAPTSTPAEAEVTLEVPIP